MGSTDQVWRRILRLAATGAAPDLSDDAPTLIVVGVEPVRDEDGNLLGTRRWLREPNAPDGRVRDPDNPGSYEDDDVM